jgi:hypothetical protein
MIKYPAMDSEQAFEFALNLPNKSLESVKKSPEMKKLAEKQKALSKYLDLLKEKEKELKLNKSNELMDDWQKAIDAQDNLSQIVEVPKEHLPVGTGKEKVSKLAARMKGALKNLTPEKIKELGLATYNQMIRTEQLEMAADYVLNNRSEALKVLKGEIDPPRGLLRNSIYRAMEEVAGGDIDLAMDLASLQSTRFGQELNILAGMDPNSPVKIMKDIVEIRERVTARKLGERTEAKVKSEIKKSLKDKIAKAKPNKYSWSTFLEEIKC